MTRESTVAPQPRSGARRRAAPDAPLVWFFDGAFATCLADMEDTFRRALVQVGDVSRIAVLIELSLPALESRLTAGEAVQPSWSRFLNAMTERYGLPGAPRVRYLKTPGPLASLVIAYRS